MKKILTSTILLVICFYSWAQDATDIIKKADAKMQGESSQSVITMKIIRPSWERSISIKMWSKGRDYSLVLITDPVKERGQTFLKRKNEMWNYVPAISRMIKLPPSMMSQGWMGSDFSNDDLLKESSIVVDYQHTIVGSEVIAGYDCYKIELMPKPDAAVVWGKVIKWVSKKDYFQLKSEYYDEDMELVRTEVASGVKKMDDREIPTHFELIPADKPGQKTVMDMESAKFNLPIEESFFSQQKMKTIK